MTHWTQPIKHDQSPHCPVLPYQVCHVKVGGEWLKNKGFAHEFAWDFVEEYVVERFEEDEGEPQDNINHPSHYTQGGIECIDAIRAALTDDEFRGFCKGNAIKYAWRERIKGGNESLGKALWYIERALNE